MRWASGALRLRRRASSPAFRPGGANNAKGGPKFPPPHQSPVIRLHGLEGEIRSTYICKPKLEDQIMRYRLMERDVTDPLALGLIHDIVSD